MSTKHTPGPWLYRGKSDSVHTTSSEYPYGERIFAFEEEHSPSQPDLDLILAAPAMFEALKAREEAERAQERYRKDSLNPPCGLNAEEAHNNWSIHLSDLAQEAFELTAKAKALRTAALAQAEPATPVQ